MTGGANRPPRGTARVAGLFVRPATTGSRERQRVGDAPPPSFELLQSIRASERHRVSRARIYVSSRHGDLLSSRAHQPARWIRGTGQPLSRTGRGGTRGQHVSPHRAGAAPSRVSHARRRNPDPSTGARQCSRCRIAGRSDPSAERLAIEGKARWLDWALRESLEGTGRMRKERRRLHSRRRYPSRVGASDPGWGQPDRALDQRERFPSARCFAFRYDASSTASSCAKRTSAGTTAASHAPARRSARKSLKSASSVASSASTRRIRS